MCVCYGFMPTYILMCCAQADSATGTDPFEALLSQLGDGNGETEDELQGLLENMMAQLMGKDVLYEPLKELSEKVMLTVQHKTCNSSHHF